MNLHPGRFVAWPWPLQARCPAGSEWDQNSDPGRRSAAQIRSGTLQNVCHGTDFFLCADAGAEFFTFSYPAPWRCSRLRRPPAGRQRPFCASSPGQLARAGGAGPRRSPRSMSCCRNRCRSPLATAKQRPPRSRQAPCALPDHWI